jgi:hypothetical protein
MPNCAIARRSQISSYKMLQNPDKRKNTRYQVTFCVLEQTEIEPLIKRSSFITLRELLLLQIKPELSTTARRPRLILGLQPFVWLGQELVILEKLGGSDMGVVYETRHRSQPLCRSAIPPATVGQDLQALGRFRDLTKTEGFPSPGGHACSPKIAGPWRTPCLNGFAARPAPRLRFIGTKFCYSNLPLVELLKQSMRVKAK